MDLTLFGKTILLENQKVFDLFWPINESTQEVSFSLSKWKKDGSSKTPPGQQHIHDAHCLIASEAEASGFAGCLRRLAGTPRTRKVGAGGVNKIRRGGGGGGGGVVFLF